MESVRDPGFSTRGSNVLGMILDEGIRVLDPNDIVQSPCAIAVRRD